MLLRIYVFSPFACGKEKGSMNPLFCQIRKFLWDICDKFTDFCWGLLENNTLGL